MMSQLRVLIVTLSLLLNGNQISCFTQPQQHHLHVNKAFGTTTVSIDTSARPSISTNANTNTISSSTTSLYSYNPYKSKNSKRYSDDKTELNRARFLLNQAKGSLKESEMRATAAERRVALLAKEIIELNSKGTDGEGSGENEGEGDDESGEEVKALNKKVSDLKDSIKAFREKMEHEIQKLQTDHEKERLDHLKRQEKLTADIDKAQSQLNKAKDEVSDLNLIVEDLTSEVTRIKKEAEEEKEALRVAHEAKVMQLKKDASEVQTSLEMVNTDLESKLTEEKKNGEMLRSDMARVQKQASDDIDALKRKSNIALDAVKKDLTFNKIELEDRNTQIETLHKERSRFRTLTKIQFHLVKSRVVKRYRKILGRGKK